MKLKGIRNKKDKKTGSKTKTQKRDISLQYKNSSKIRLKNHIRNRGSAMHDQLYTGG